jgi:hypothetical protein
MTGNIYIHCYHAHAYNVATYIPKALPHIYGLLCFISIAYRTFPYTYMSNKLIFLIYGLLCTYRHKEWIITL